MEMNSVLLSMHGGSLEHGVLITVKTKMFLVLSARQTVSEVNLGHIKFMSILIINLYKSKANI